MTEDPKYTARRLVGEFVARDIDLIEALAGLMVLGVARKAARDVLEDLTKGAVSKPIALERLGFDNG